MENEMKYQRALALFEREAYEEAVELFIQLYEDGYEQETILNFLYDCFVTPNEAEFRKNYNENSDGNGYEELLLDFVPVSDTKYYIFHKGCGSFAGSIDISGEEPQAQPPEVHSVLIADIWDLRDMLPYIRMRGWSFCYILLGENKNALMSFFKLPDIRQKYFKNAGLFDDVGHMKRFFTENPDCYLPKEIVSGHIAQYREILYELRRKRLEDMRTERTNILLSVCIPSYGRGSTCLENVRNILQVEYDSEIEIVVSNNGSAEDTEGYEAIQNMRDSRITYHAFEENQGYARNLLKTLELAKGRFAVFTSDEDFMRVENLHGYMNYLIHHADAGLLMAAGIGANFGPPKEERCQTGWESYGYATTLNYLTGLTVNRFWVERNHVFERISANIGNRFVSVYTHIALALLTVEQTTAVQSDLVLWEAGAERENVEENGAVILSYMHYESRIEQQNALAEFEEKVMRLGASDLIRMLMANMRKTYFLCGVAYRTRTRAYRELIDWRDLCVLLHQNNLKLFEHFRGYLAETGAAHFWSDMEKLFFEQIAGNPMASVLSDQEKTDYKVVEEIAKYQFRHGKPIAGLDYPDLEKKWRAFLETV